MSFDWGFFIGFSFAFMIFILLIAAYFAGREDEKKNNKEVK